MRIYVALTVFIAAAILVIPAQGQLMQGLPGLYQPGVSSFHQPTDTADLSHLNYYTPGETNFSLDMGTGYTSFGRGSGFSSSYISPMVSFAATDRLQLTLGGRFSHNNMGNLPMVAPESSSEMNAFDQNNPTEAFLFGRYLVSERISVFGMGSFGQNQLYYSPYRQGFGSTDYQQFAVGMDYKVSRNVTLGASFGYTNSPMWGSPFGSRGLHSPFP